MDVVQMHSAGGGRGSTIGSLEQGRVTPLVALLSDLPALSGPQGPWDTFQGHNRLLLRQFWVVNAPTERLDQAAAWQGCFDFLSLDYDL